MTVASLDPLEGRCPASRIRRLNDKDIAPTGSYVLYWMIAHRRSSHHFGLDRARDWAEALDKPLVILEALRCGYRWASLRLHRFIVEGMADNLQAFASKPVTYYPYVEAHPDQGKGLLRELASDSALVLTDDFPCFMLPRMSAAAASQVPVRMEAIDANGLYPMYDTERQFTVAHSFRRHLQKQLLPHLEHAPSPAPFEGWQAPQPVALPASIRERWPPCTARQLDDLEWLSELPIASEPGPVSQFPGGAQAAQDRWQAFLERLHRYPDDRNHPDDDVSSGLSPYLHFGHISAHQMFWELMQHEEWDISHIAPKPNGKREGWWGASAAAESFLDELITWRELGYNMCATNPEGYDTYASLPAWAQTTLHAHLDDPRPHLYSLSQLAAAETHDPLWNAAQRQLVREGRIHNYMRMLWGKKILEWSPTPQDALEVLIELNNRYALDGRNPNSYSGIFWVLGRYDRAWGPERPIFGKVRYMSSQSASKKLRLSEYLQTYQSFEEET